MTFKGRLRRGQRGFKGLVWPLAFGTLGAGQIQADFDGDAVAATGGSFTSVLDGKFTGGTDLAKGGFFLLGAEAGGEL